jgi:glutamine---fructose-6-phosphate transaminase (isomerizing)
MCGIFGLQVRRGAPYSSAFIKRALRVLAKESQSRGKDSSGMVFVDQTARSYEVLKGAVPLSWLLQAPTVSTAFTAALKRYDDTADGRAKPFVAMGHSRLVTNGSQLNDENNQPVVKSGIIGVHNGILVNDASIWDRNPSLCRDYEIDTEVFLALMRAHLDTGYDIPAAIARSEGEIEGTISTAMLIPERDSFVLYTNNGSLYTLTDDSDALFFASEYYPLRVLGERMKLDVGGKYRIEQLEAGTGVTLEGGGFPILRFVSGEHRDDTPRCTNGRKEVDSQISVTSVGDGKPQSELVKDVALIARAPEAPRLEAMLEFNEERIARLRRCSKCLLPATFPFIEYDGNGVCNYCRNHKIRNHPKPLEDLLELLKPYRSKNGKPDCIVPFSGGRDSTYALHVIKRELGLKPIAFTYDWGMVTDLGRRNIARACGKLGVENIIVAADIRWKRENIRKNITAWLRKPHLGMIPLFMAGDKYFYYYVDQVKRQTGIALNIWGINPMENTDFKVGFMGVGPDHEKKHIYSLSIGRQFRLIKGVVQAIAANPAYLNSSVFDTLGSFISRSVMPHRDYFHLYDYIRWDEKEIDSVLLSEYNWETAVDTQTTWRIGDGTAAFYNYIYFTVAGFSEHDTFRSNQIREGMMSREEGLRLVNDENRPRYPTIKWYTDVVGIDYEHAVKTINSITKLYG